MTRIALFGGTPVLSKEAHRVWPLVEEEERRAVARVLDRGILSGPFAPESVALEQEFARYVGAKHCLLTHCGTSALVVALAAAGVRTGDEVIVPAYSFVATPLAVVQLGAVPVFADVDVATGCLDAASAETAVTSRTRAIMPVHMHGCAADMAALLDVARRHDLVVVEDAAQAHGATFGGKPVGAIGAAGGFSLQSSKNLSAGEGGLFVTNDDAVAEEAGAVRNFGQPLPRTDAASYDVTRPLDDAVAGVQAHRVDVPRQRDDGRFCPGAAGQASGSHRAGAAQRRAPGRGPHRAPRHRCASRSQRDGRRCTTSSACTSIPPKAGLAMAVDHLRDALIHALRAEGLEVVFWQAAPLSAQTVFQKRDPLDGFPRAQPGGTDLTVNYQAARYPEHARAARWLAGPLLPVLPSHRPG